MKHLFRAGSPYRATGAFIALDGSGLRRIVHRAIGSRRLRVEVEGPGGHSWADRGAPNPIVAVGATVPRDLPIPGRELGGIHQAMEFLPLANRAVTAHDPITATPISAAGKRVVIIGGGDTGADKASGESRSGSAIFRFTFSIVSLLPVVPSV